MIPAFAFAIGLAAFTCTPTHPNGTQPPDEVVFSPAFNEGRLAEAYRAGKTRPDPHFHGNGAIWTPLPFDGRFVVRPRDVSPDGSIGLKFPWFVARTGNMTVTGRRLDADGPAVTASISTVDGEPRMHPSSVYFATPGCWEVTARTPGTAPLTFVIDLQVEDT